MGITIKHVCFVVFVFGVSVGSATASNCPVTEPGQVTFSNEALAVVLPPDKRFVFSPDHPGFIDQHGALGIKVGWMRNIKGQLQVTGRPVGDQSPRVRAWIADGYGDSGFQTSYVLFPRPGCWEVTGSLGEHRLIFIVEVELIAAGPSWRHQGPEPGWRETGG